MLQDTFKVTGQILLRRYDENGNLNLEREHKNLVVTTGKQLIASRLFCDTRAMIPITSITASSPAIGSATINFATQLTVPYDVGAYVTISGAIPIGYNGTYRVKSVTLSTIVIDTNVTGTMTTAGQIDPLPNSNVKTMKVGEGDTVANLSDISLYTEIGTGVPLYSSALDFEDDKASVVYIAFFPAGTSTSTAGLREAALVNSTPKMLCRTVFPTVTKSALESLEIFWTVTIN
jgi:hypothetical protein